MLNWFSLDKAGQNRTSQLEEKKDFPVTLKVHFVQGHVCACVKIVQSLNFSLYKENKNLK